MSNGNKYEMSQEHFAKLKEELAYLQTVRTKEVAEHLKEARSFGDASENSELDEAKEERDKLYTKIAEIQSHIEHAVIITTTAVAGTVGHDSRVKVLDVEAGDVEEYKIVGSQEANPMDGKISSDSPLGRGLLGHVVGDTVTVDAPAGPIVFEILEVN